MNFGRVYGIAHIVTLSVGYMGDKVFALAKLVADKLYNIDILHLVVTAYIINLTHSAFVQNKVNRLAMVFNIKPVANIKSLAVNGKRLIVKAVCYH